MTMAASVTVDVVPDADVPSYNVKIGTDTFEVNIIVPVAEANRLHHVREATWGAGALRIGTSAGAPAWWCVGDKDGQKTLSILVGHDDETWQIALALPIETIDDVLQEIADAPTDDSGGQ
jgi:hypothetical protein